jgi:hypothetical protein
MTTTKATTVRFISKFRELKFVRTAAYTKEVDGRVVHVPGESIRFSDGVYATADPATIEFLRARPEFEDIFVEVPESVDAAAHRQQHLETLEEREKALKQKEIELEKREARLGSEEGGSVQDEFAGLSQKDLLAIALDEGVEGLKGNASKASIIEAIEAKRNEVEDDAPQF